MQKDEVSRSGASWRGGRDCPCGSCCPNTLVEPKPRSHVLVPKPRFFPQIFRIEITFTRRRHRRPCQRKTAAVFRSPSCRKSRNSTSASLNCHPSYCK
jgi:hypothetical protein